MPDAVCLNEAASAAGIRPRSSEPSACLPPAPAALRSEAPLTSAVAAAPLPEPEPDEVVRVSEVRADEGDSEAATGEGTSVMAESLVLEETDEEEALWLSRNAEEALEPAPTDG